MFIVDAGDKTKWNNLSKKGNWLVSDEKDTLLLNKGDWNAISQNSNSGKITTLRNEF